MGKINRLIVVILILSLLMVYTMKLREKKAGEISLPDFSLIPSESGHYSSDDYYIGIESLKVLGADTTLVRSYTSPGGMEIEFFLGYFSSQQENSQIHSPKHCYPGSGWDIISEEKLRIDFENGPGSVKRLMISNGREERLVIYWFSMNGDAIPDEFSLKYHQMKNTLLSRPQAAAFIRFSTVVRPGGDKNIEEEMFRFISGINPDIMAALKPGRPLKNRG
ncbi:MAG: EpsI family protein [Candidatus Krumholzibacteriota bacterium]|nr:EpsI family protein [Candidatus Krumholzibacteriota bacterium]